LHDAVKSREETPKEGMNGEPFKGKSIVRCTIVKRAETLS